MIDLVLAAEDVDAIRRELIGGDAEGCAILFATDSVQPGGKRKLLVRNVYFPSEVDYSRRGYLEAELNPECVARVTKRARNENVALVFVHSHPGTQAPVFSMIDADGEEHLARFLAHRHPELAHAALVVSAGGMQARRLGTTEGIRVIGIGAHRQVLVEPASVGTGFSEVFDRQVRAFGAAGQEALRSLKIAIVGLGGMGSLVAQQLAHLGVRSFVLVDPDTVEETNLNRVASATRKDVGRPKIEVAKAYIRSVANDAEVTCLKGDVTRVKTARGLLDADLILGCTDSHGSRAILQQVSYQYLIPCIDTGTTIAVANDRVTHIYGRVQLLAPGFACLTCSSLLDAAEVRRDMMNAFERQADPYLQGAREPAPAVMSINGTVASLAVTMLLAVVSGIPVAGRYFLYNAMAPSLRSVKATPNPTCYICSRSGSYARGDSWPLLARQDQDDH
jgi:molybdopterin/thiamine biosynthesis adenylyltransferase